MRFFYSVEDSVHDRIIKKATSLYEARWRMSTYLGSLDSPKDIRRVPVVIPPDILDTLHFLLGSVVRVVQISFRCSNGFIKTRNDTWGIAQILYGPIVHLRPRLIGTTLDYFHIETLVEERPRRRFGAAAIFHLWTMENLN